MHVRLFIAFMLASSAASAAPSVYGESAMVKVQPAAAPRPDTGVGLSGGRNEFVAFQVVVHGGEAGATGVRATFDGLTSKAGTISGKDVTLYRVDMLNLTQVTFPGAEKGDWPDALVPDRDENHQEQRNAFPFKVAAKQARAIWVDVHIPIDAKPGVYGGGVVVTGDNGLLSKVPVTLTVLDFTLPSTPSMTSAFMLFPGNVCLAHTGDSNCHYDDARRNALTNDYVKMALEHRISLSNTFYQPANNDWSGYDKAYGQYLDGTSDARLPGAKLTSVQFTAARTAANYAAFAAHLKAKGWFDRAFDYTGDEPPYGITYAAIAQRQAMVRQAAPDLATLVTTTIQNATQNGIVNAVNILAPVVNYLDGTEAPYKGDRRADYNAFLNQNGHKLWTYQSCMSHGCGYGTNAPENTGSTGWPAYAVDSSAGRNRAMEWVSFLLNVGGELYYETAQTLPSAWSNQYSYNGNGDGNLFYPGTPARIGGGSDVPVASIRLKLLRQSMQDYEWLKAVSDAGDPTFARTVAKAVAPAAYKAADDGTAYDRARLELASRYLQLTHKGTAVAVQGAPPAAPDADPASAIINGADPVTLPGTGAEALSTTPAGTPVPNGAASALKGKLVKGGCSIAPEGNLLPAVLLLGALLLLSLRRRRVPAPVRAQRRSVRQR